MPRTTSRRLTRSAAIGATAVAALTGVVVSATPASAGVVVNKPWKHTITVETTNVRVLQNNWVRADSQRTEGYRSARYSYADGDGGYLNHHIPFAENTGGFLQARDTDTFSEGSKLGTSRYDGGIFLAAELDLTVWGPYNAYPKGYDPRDSFVNTYELAANDTTGWRHIEVITGNGDFIKMDYRITNNATPQL